MASSDESIIEKVQEIATKAAENSADYIINGLSNQIRSFGVERFRKVILGPLFSTPPFVPQQTDAPGVERLPIGQTKISDGDVAYGLICDESSDKPKAQFSLKM